jgi:putative ABC transport system substrate-binding protein
MQLDHLKRREFITLLGGAAAAWSLVARAQQSERVRRIGVLSSLGGEDRDMTAWLAAFRQELEHRGWSEGRNIRIEMRFAGADAKQVQAQASELVALEPEVIFAQSTEATAALQKETRTIPIVFVAVSDPIGSGFVGSLARPGGNFTGLLNFEATITGKWLAMLKEIAPPLARVALVADPKPTPYDYFLRAAKAAIATLAIELVSLPTESAADIERSITSFASAPNGGLLLIPDSTTIVHRDLVIALAARHRLPAVYSARFFVAAGGLMSYGTDRADVFRQAASYVDRILRGAKPADMPVQTPVKYETVVNLKTAKALGLAVPPSMLVRADEVIE